MRVYVSNASVEWFLLLFQRTQIFTYGAATMDFLLVHRFLVGIVGPSNNNNYCGNSIFYYHLYVEEFVDISEFVLKLFHICDARNEFSVYLSIVCY